MSVNAWHNPRPYDEHIPRDLSWTTVDSNRACRARASAQCVWICGNVKFNTSKYYKHFKIMWKWFEIHNKQIMFTFTSHFSPIRNAFRLTRGSYLVLIVSVLCPGVVQGWVPRGTGPRAGSPGSLGRFPGFLGPPEPGSSAQSQKSKMSNMSTNCLRIA